MDTVWGVSGCVEMLYGVPPGASAVWAAKNINFFWGEFLSIFLVDILIFYYSYNQYIVMSSKFIKKEDYNYVSKVI